MPRCESGADGNKFGKILQKKKTGTNPGGLNPVLYFDDIVV
jgi:hypothetical protein